MSELIEVKRVFNAPIEMVWQLWTDPKLLKRWWGPKNFSSPFARINFKVGEQSLVSMKAADSMGGQEYYSSWRYEKIVLHEYIEFVQSLCDEQGKGIDPTSVGMPADFPKNIRTCVTFKVLSKNTTEMTITEHATFGSISNFAKIGLEQSMDKMVTIFE